MSKYAILQVASIIIGTAGFVYLGISVDWRASFAVFLMIWGNNLGNKAD
jgi:hypothetical protein